MKYLTPLLITMLVLAACSSPEARKPIVRKTGSFMNESIERNKVLNTLENQILMKKMETDSVHDYYNSSHGFWYYYVNRSEQDAYSPKRGDEVFFTHEIRALNDSVLYKEQDLGTKSYLVDKEELITGLQDGIKLMKEGETVTFLFPSHKAYGYAGNDKVRPNEPLIYTVKLLKINKLSENENN
jgi:gliding motility-associated peptidyl-prolyl isomerase